MEYILISTASDYSNSDDQSVSNSVYRCNKQPHQIVLNICSLIISSYAAYLSWSCNVGVNSGLRVLYALSAFMFGIIYLILYVIFRLPECSAAFYP